MLRYQSNKRIILQHIGSAHTGEALSDLMVLAEELVKDNTRQVYIFSDENPNRLLHLNHCTFIGIKNHFFHRQIRALPDIIKLDDLPALLNDLVMIGIFEPTSKLRSLELIEQFLDISHSRMTYYKIAPGCINLKKTLE